MKMYLELSHDEIQKMIPYQIIAETTSRSIWDTGSRKRLWKERFTEQEQDACSRIRKQAHSWALVRGVPEDGVKMTIGTYNLWYKLAEFCASIG